MAIRFLAALAALSVSAAASAMPVQSFLTRAEALQAKGPLALFSSDYKLLSKAIRADAFGLKAEREAAKAAGKTPAYCPPGPVKLTSNDIMQMMRAVPSQRRATTDTRDVLRAYFARRFPCGR